MGGNLGDLVRERVYATQPMLAEQVMTQDEFDRVHTELVALSEQYAQGLVTIIEYLNKVVDMRMRIGLRTNICGLIDPASGIRLPSEEELRKLDAVMTFGLGLPKL